MADSIRVQTSRTSRSLAVRIEGGELNARLKGLAAERQIRFGAFRGRGVLQDPGLLAFDASRGEYTGSRALQGWFEATAIEGWIVSRGGGVELEVSAVLQQGGTTVSGRLAGGRVRTLTLSIECWDDVDPNALDAGAADAGAGASQTAAPKTLTEAAAALERRPSAPPDPHASDVERLEPEPGDFLEHPSFGIVEFEGEEESGRVRIKLASGSHREIMLDVFDIVAREPRNGKPLYALRPRRR
jgi:predicted DNA-binding protein with PD1-like motif